MRSGIAAPRSPTSCTSRGRSRTRAWTRQSTSGPPPATGRRVPHGAAVLLDMVVRIYPAPLRSPERRPAWTRQLNYGLACPRFLVAFETMHLRLAHASWNGLVGKHLPQRPLAPLKSPGSTVAAAQSQQRQGMCEQFQTRTDKSNMRVSQLTVNTNFSMRSALPVTSQDRRQVCKQCQALTDQEDIQQLGTTSALSELAGAASRVRAVPGAAGENDDSVSRTNKKTLL